MLKCFHHYFFGYGSLKRKIGIEEIGRNSSTTIFRFDSSSNVMYVSRMQGWMETVKGSWFSKIWQNDFGKRGWVKATRHVWICRFCDIQWFFFTFLIHVRRTRVEVFCVFGLFLDWLGFRDCYFWKGGILNLEDCFVGTLVVFNLLSKRIFLYQIVGLHRWACLFLATWWWC